MAHNEQIIESAAQIVGHSIPPPKRPSPFILALLLTKKLSTRTDGRDVLLKVPQYLAACALLWTGIPAKSETAVRLQNLRSSFSATRRVIRLGHIVTPLTAAIELVADLRSHPEDGKKLAQPKTAMDFARLLAVFQLFLGLANDVADDLGTLAQIGVLPPAYSHADWFGSRLWATGNFIDQFETYEATIQMETKVNMLAEAGELKRVEVLKNQLFMARVLQAQLVADAVFLACDLNPLLVSRVAAVFFPTVKQERHVAGVAAAAGMVSGLLGMYRAFVRAAAES